MMLLFLGQFPMTRAASSERTPERMPSLDGMRGACVLLVLFSHTVGSSHFPSLYVLGELAAIGVIVFFVLSGFLITTPWNVLAAVAVASSSYYLIERPCLKLKSRFIRTKVELLRKVAVPVLTEHIA
jgi:peptidoglycan/LPS O-acetylase OafA/YrhL